MSKLLSICIPTYNMVLYLEKNLDKLLNIISNRKLNKYIQICISDNNSSDSTEHLLKNKYLKNDKIDIKYVKNKQNIGADRNYLSVIEMATGKYCWFLGADDLITSDSINYIIDIIAKTNIDILLGNRNEMDIKERILNSSPIYIPNYLVSKDNFSKYLANCINLMGIFSYISTIVFKKSLWNKVIITKEYQNFIGSQYIHAFILIKIISLNGKLMVTKKPIVNCRLGNDSFLEQGYFQRIVYDFNYLRIINNIFNLHSSEMKNIIILLYRTRKTVHYLKSKYLINNKNQLKEFIFFLNKNQIPKKNIIIYTPKFIIFFLLKIHQIFSKFKHISKENALDN